MNKIGNTGSIIPKNITSPKSWISSVLTVVALLVVLGIGYYLYKKGTGMIGAPTGGPTFWSA